MAGEQSEKSDGGAPDDAKRAGNQANGAKNGNGNGKRQGRTPLIILAVVVIIIVVGVGLYWFANRNIETTDDAQTDGNSVTIAPKVSGYVVTLAITDNQRVKKGDLLVKIDPRDYVVARDKAKAALALAEAQRDNAQVNLDTTLVSAPAKLAQSKAQRDSAAASRDLAQAELRRQTAVDKRATTQQSIDQATAQARSATANVADDEAQVKVAELVAETISQAKAQLDQSVAQVAQAKAQLDQAELDLSYTEVRAPQDGWVTKRNVQLGSYLQPGQSIFSLVTPDVWITANFKENQLDRMRPGQKVEIRIDAYGDLRLHGHVDSIQMGTGSRFSAFPAENATGNYVKIVQRVPVKIVIDSGLDPNLPLPLGLSVDPSVTLE